VGFHGKKFLFSCKSSLKIAVALQVLGLCGGREDVIVSLYMHGYSSIGYYQIYYSYQKYREAYSKKIAL
jgi:hypothetical protein